MATVPRPVARVAATAAGCATGTIGSAGSPAIERSSAESGRTLAGTGTRVLQQAHSASQPAAQDGAIARAMSPHPDPSTAVPFGQPNALCLTCGKVVCGSRSGADMTLAARIFVARVQAASRKAARKRRSELERELAGYATSAERADLEATLDRYPDGATHELRDILARQSMATHDSRFPAIGRS
jgi:hypothetical protein